MLPPYFAPAASLPAGSGGAAVSALQPCSLPPRVRGPVRGQVQLRVEQVLWFDSSRLLAASRGGQGLECGTTLVRMKWWGEQGEGCVWRPAAARMDTDGQVTFPPKPLAPGKPAPPPGATESEYAAAEASHAVSFPVVVSPSTFTAYLTDAQWIVFEVFHFVETDAAAIHRQFLRHITRAAHPNRAAPQHKPALGHVMLDLAGLIDSLSYGELQWSGSKNLPVLVDGTAVGQVSVSLSSRLDSGLAAGPAPRDGNVGGFDPLRDSFEEPEVGLRPAAVPQPHPYPSAVAAAAGPSRAPAPQPASHVAAASPAATSSPFSPTPPAFASSSRSRATAPFLHSASTSDDLALASLISEAESMALHLGAESSSTGAATNMDVREYIESHREQQRQQQQQQHAEEPKQSSAPLPSTSALSHSQRSASASSQHEREHRVHFAPSSASAPPVSDDRSYGLPAAPLAHSSYAAAPSALASSSSSSSASARPLLASQPPFAAYRPAPEHYFPLPAVPAAAFDTPPPFAPTAARTKAEDPLSFIDPRGLIHVGLRVRRIVLDSAHVSGGAERLGGRHSDSSLADAAAGISAAASINLDLLRASKGKGKSGGSSQAKGWTVLHWQLFPDLLMSRSPAVRAPSAVTKPSSSPSTTWFHLSDHAPRVYSRSLLSALTDGALALDVVHYAARPSWKDARDGEGLRFAPREPNQTIVAQARVPLEALAGLPTTLPSVPHGSSWLQSFLAAHTARAQQYPLVHPVTGVRVGVVDLSLSWGSVDDLETLARIEGAAIKAQQLVRGFIVRRRARRERIEAALAEEAQQEEEERSESELPVPLHRKAASMTSPRPTVSAAALSPAPSARGTHSAGTAFSPRPLVGSSPRVQSGRTLSFRDMATSPLPSAPSGQQHGVHLNLPAASAGKDHFASPPHPAPSTKHTPRTARTTAGAAAGDSSPQQLHSHAPPSSSSASGSLAPTVPLASSPFVPRPRAEDRRDFVVYTFSSRGSTSAGAAGAPNAATRIKSFGEALDAIQAAREAKARGEESPTAEVVAPTQPTPLSPSELARLASPPRSVGQRTHPTPAQMREAFEERKQKIDADSFVREEEKHARSPSPVRARSSALGLSPLRTSSIDTSAALSPAAATTVAADEEAFLGEEYEDTDVDEYSDDDDDEFAARPSEAFGLTSGAPQLVQRYASTAAPAAHPHPHPSALYPFSPLDSSASRRSLAQQMRELDELQRRLEWKLHGGKSEDFPTTPLADDGSDERKAVSPAKIASPLQAGPLSPVRPSTVLSPQQQQPQRHTPFTPTTPAHFLSPEPSPAAAAGVERRSPFSLPGVRSPVPQQQHHEPASRSPQSPSPAVQAVSRSPPAQAASPSPLPAVSSPPLTRGHSAASIPEDLSDPVPLPSATPPVRSEDEYSDDDSDGSVSSGDEDDADEEDALYDRVVAQLRLHGSHQVNVSVQGRDLAPAAVRVTSDTAAARAQLFPHGLHGQHAAPIAMSAHEPGAAVKPRSPPPPHMSEAEAREVERISRVLTGAKPHAHES